MAEGIQHAHQSSLRRCRHEPRARAVLVAGRPSRAERCQRQGDTPTTPLTLTVRVPGKQFLRSRNAAHEGERRDRRRSDAPGHDRGPGAQQGHRGSLVPVGTHEQLRTLCTRQSRRQDRRRRGIPTTHVQRIQPRRKQAFAARDRSRSVDRSLGGHRIAQRDRRHPARREWIPGDVQATPPTSWRGEWLRRLGA